MRYKTVAAAIFLSLIAIGARPAAAQGNPEAVFATVNGDNIKSGDFWHRLAWYRVDPTNPLATLPAGFLTVNQLITEKLIYQMARDKGCAPSDVEIQAELKRQETNDPNLLSDLKSEGRPESDLYEQVKYDLTQYKLKTFGITITDQEVEDHYKNYPSEFTRPKEYKLRVIVVSSDDEAAAVDKELASGKSFGDVATAHSLDVSKGGGGEFGTVAVASLGPGAATALASTKIGQVTDWVQGTQGNGVKVKYLLEDIVPSAVQPLDDNLRAQIRKKLALDRGEIKNQVFKDLHQVTVAAKVVINQAGYQKIYDQMIASYEKAHPNG